MKNVVVLGNGDQLVEEVHLRSTAMAPFVIPSNYKIASLVGVFLNLFSYHVGYYFLSIRFKDSYSEKNEVFVVDFGWNWHAFCTIFIKVNFDGILVPTKYSIII